MWPHLDIVPKTYDISHVQSLNGHQQWTMNNKWNVLHNWMRHSLLFILHALPSKMVFSIKFLICFFFFLSSVEQFKTLAHLAKDKFDQISNTQRHSTFNKIAFVFGLLFKWFFSLEIQLPTHNLRTNYKFADRLD